MREWEEKQVCEAANPHLGNSPGSDGSSGSGTPSYPNTPSDIVDLRASWCLPRSEPSLTATWPNSAVESPSYQAYGFPNGYQVPCMPQRPEAHVQPLQPHQAVLMPAVAILPVAQWAYTVQAVNQPPSTVWTPESCQRLEVNETPYQEVQETDSSKPLAPCNLLSSGTTITLLTRTDRVPRGIRPWIIPGPLRYMAFIALRMVTQLSDNVDISAVIRYRFPSTKPFEPRHAILMTNWLQSPGMPGGLKERERAWAFSCGGAEQVQLEAEILDDLQTARVKAGYTAPVRRYSFVKLDLPKHHSGTSGFLRALWRRS